jgi:hypothetical protein
MLSGAQETVELPKASRLAYRLELCQGRRTPISVGEVVSSILGEEG